MDFESDAWERARRRPGEDRAVGDREKAAVTAAFEGAFIGAVEERAGIVRADPAVSDVRGIGGADEDARRNVGRVLEDSRAADGDFACMRDDDNGRRAHVIPLANDDERPGENCANRDGDGFGEAAARGLVTWRVNAGCRLRRFRGAVRHGFTFLAWAWRNKSSFFVLLVEWQLTTAHIFVPLICRAFSGHD